jgi:hypothetical protein
VAISRRPTGGASLKEGSSMGIRYQLIDQVLFVDAKDYQSQDRYPKEIPSAHILDQRMVPNEYLMLDDNAAYIARFIVQGVDIDLIPEILKSEYRTTLGNKVDKIDFVAEVTEVKDILYPKYLKTPRDYPRNYEHPKPPASGKHVEIVGGVEKPLKGYELDFRVNWFVIGCCKFPC